MGLKARIVKIYTPKFNFLIINNYFPKINQEYDPLPIALPNALQDLNVSEFKILPSVDRDSENQTVFVRSKSVKLNFLGL